MESRYDCIVLGAGVAGLGAALTLKDAGFTVCVLEKENRVGGRMTTDRTNGFVIDRGVTILGDGFKNFKQLVKRFSLQKHVSPIPFSFGLVEEGKRIKFRAKRLDDLLFKHDFKFGTRLSLSRLGMDVLFNSNKLYHGQSAQCGGLDDESVADYLQRISGSELKDRVLAPGMTCAFGGHFEESSKLILLQTIRNILLTGSWTIDEGVDLIPETMAKHVPVKLNCTITSIEYQQNGVTVKTSDGESYLAKSVVIALPGNKVQSLCPSLPGKTLQMLNSTRYGKMTNVHLGMKQVVAEKYVGMGLTKSKNSNFILELEHNRCKALCPSGKSMVSVFWWDSMDNKISGMNELDIEQQSKKALQSCLPNETQHIEFSHLIKWDTGIAHFPVGRLRETGEFRKEMQTWNLPVQLCGDYLDGLSCEGALQTGIEAGNNLINYLNRNKHGI